MPLLKSFPNSGLLADKPKQYEEMTKLAEKLAKDILFARIDFFANENSIYFSELTLYPDAGYAEFDPIEYDYLFGSWLTLPQTHNAIQCKQKK